MKVGMEMEAAERDEEDELDQKSEGRNRWITALHPAEPP